MLTKLLKISLPVLFSLFLFVLFIFPLSVKAKPPEGKVPKNAIVVKPVNGITVGPGKKLWVFAFPARGGKPGPPGGGGGSGGTDCSALCDDFDTNSEFSSLGFTIPAGLGVNINSDSIPIGGDVTGAIASSFTTWNTANGALGLSVTSSGGADGPAEDDIHTVGWVRIVPKRVLAATWVWTQDNVVTEVDIFFNLFHEWDVLEEGECGGSKFDVEAICTHEAGHLIGLGHVSDDCKMATMYPSAPKGETKKRSLTDGDSNGAIDRTP